MIVLASFLLSLSALTQNPAPVQEKNVRAHEEFLASDAMNGRGSMTDDERRAAVYIGEQFKKFGVDPAGDKDTKGVTGYVQTVPLTRQSFAAAPTLTAGDKTFTHAKDMAVLRIGAAKVTGTLQKLTAGTKATPGAVVYLHLTEDGIAVRQQMMVPMQQGAALLVIADSVQIRQRFKAASGQTPELPIQIGATAWTGAPEPSIVILNDEATKVFDAIAEGTQVTLGGDVKTGKPSFTYNAMGMLRGSDAKQSAEVVLLTAHLDHLGKKEGMSGDNIYNGADDDASGVTAVLEMARAIGGGPKPKRTVYFVCFGSEEVGGYGARYFLDHPPVPLESMVANLEFEMIGQADTAVKPDELWLTGWERSNLGPELAKQGAKLVGDPHPDQQFFFRSDNIALARRGVVAQTVSSFGLHKQYHQPDDDIAHLDFAHMTQAINSMVKPVLWLVNSDFKPQWNPGGKP